MGLIRWMVMVRPPCSWLVVSRMSFVGTVNSGFGGEGGRGVPSGIGPRMRAVVGDAAEVMAGSGETFAGWTSEKTGITRHKTPKSRGGSIFIRLVGVVRSFLVDGEVRRSLTDDRDGLWHSPRSQLGHTPPPPRPFGRFGGIVAIDADRCKRGFLLPHPPKANA